MKAIFHPEAHEEMIESARFYEGKGEGLGLDFLTSVEAATRRIEQFPESVPISEAHIRKRLVTGFPFTILYELQSDRIFIAAVMHQHRRPGYWRKRIEFGSEESF
jgi:hypothetical protein